MRVCGLEFGDEVVDVFAEFGNEVGRVGVLTFVLVRFCVVGVELFLVITEKDVLAS